ncbi:MAG: polysaccharide deacetylase family protein [Flavobacterium sp.]
MSFWIKTNRFVKWIFPNYVWDIPNNKNEVFLTFDDGPTPEITEWVLEQLKTHNAKATFFCIGNNIEKHPDIFRKIITEGHAIGNHTFNHLKGWQTDNATYIENTALCLSAINNNRQPTTDNQLLFRPPYGKIKPSQATLLRKQGYKIIMWDVISFDFDKLTSQEQCLQNVLANVQPGSIIVFHDSVKAERNLKFALPKTLEFLKEKGFSCSPIEL